MPKDKEAIARAEKAVEEFLRKTNSPELVPWIERIDYFYRRFDNSEAERLRVQLIALNILNESWIPAVKSGTYSRFELYDLATDPGQQTDLSAQLPDVVTRLKKKLLEINASVMADVPDWE